MEIIYAILIILVAALLQGMTSFGASLVAMPLLLMFYDTSIVVPLLISFNLIMNIILFRKLYKFQNLKSILPMLVTALIFTIIGLYFLKELNTNYIKLIIGVILVLLSVIKLFGIVIPLKQTLSTYIPVGIISGLLNGIAGLSGPPVLIFLSANKIEKNVFRATLTAYFLVLNIFTVISFSLTGNYSLDVLNHLIILLPALLIGVSLGVYMGNKVNEELFKKLVLVFLGLMGTYMIINSII